MYKKTIKYEDYNGVEREEDFYFNLSKAELMELELGIAGGYTTWVKRIIAAQDIPTLITIFKELLLKTYGEKSADGKRFIKSPELSEAFSQTEAYSIMFMEMATNTKAASDFFNGIAPKDSKIDPKELEEETKKLMNQPTEASMSASLAAK